MRRKYLPTLAELIDRLVINSAKRESWIMEKFIIQQAGGIGDILFSLRIAKLIYEW